MPDQEPLSPEVAAKAAIREAEHFPTGGTLPPEDELARGILERKKKDSAGSALQLAKESAVNSGPIQNGARFDRLIHEGFGWKRNETSGDLELTSEEISLKNEAEKYKDLAKKYSEEGFDALDDRTEKKWARDLVEEGLSRFPHIKAELASLSDPQKEVLLNDILKNPQFSIKVRGILEGNVDDFLKNNDPNVLKSRVFEAHRQLTKAETAITKNRTRYANAESSLTKTKGILNQFETKRSRSKGKELEDIRGEIITTKTKIITFEEELRDLTNELDDANRKLNGEKKGTDEYRGFSEDVGVAKRNLNNKKSELINAKTELENMQEKEKELLEEKSEHEAEVKRLEEEKERLDEEHEELKYQKIKAQTDFEIASGEKMRQETALISEFKNTLSEAAMDTANNKLSEIEEIHNKILEEKAEKASSEAEEKVFKSLETRYGRSVRSKKFGIDRGWKYEYDREKIATDWQTLMSQGPEAVSKNILLQNSINPNLDENKELLGKIQADMLKKLVGGRVKKGGISNGEAEILMNSDWGAEAVNGALAENEAKASQLKELLAKEGISGDPIEFIRKNKGKLVLGGIGLAALLAILAFGGVGAAALSAGGSAGKGLLSSRS